MKQGINYRFWPVDSSRLPHWGQPDEIYRVLPIEVYAVRLIPRLAVSMVCRPALCVRDLHHINKELLACNPVCELLVVLSTDGRWRELPSSSEHEISLKKGHFFLGYLPTWKMAATVGIVSSVLLSKARSRCISVRQAIFDYHTAETEFQNKMKHSFHQKF